MKNTRFLIMLFALVLIVFATMLIIRSYNPSKKLQQTHREELAAAAELQSMLGEAYILYNRNDLNAAEKRLHLLLRSNPDNISALQMLGNIYYTLKKYDEAATIFTRLIEIDELSSVHYNNLGQVLFQQNKVAEAVFYFKRAIELAPDIAQPHLNLAEAYIRLNNKKLAISELKKAFEIEKQKNSITINFSAFNALKNEKEFQELIKLNTSGEQK